MYLATEDRPRFRNPYPLKKAPLLDRAFFGCLCAFFFPGLRATEVAGGAQGNAGPQARRRLAATEWDPGYPPVLFRRQEYFAHDDSVLNQSIRP
jgi:hypothetical protein